jgi:cobalamin biosynthesis protein CbiD
MEESVSKRDNWAGSAVLAGAAAIGSAALAAALLYSSRRKEKAQKVVVKTPLGDAPETD